MERTRLSSLCRTAGEVSIHRSWRKSLIHSSLLSRRASAWACRSADQSSNPTKGDCGQMRIRWAGQSCNLPSRFARRTLPMNDMRPTIFVVDDDASVREALGNLLESVGFDTELFGSTEQFRSASRPDAPSCLVLD